METLVINLGLPLHTTDKRGKKSQRGNLILYNNWVGMIISGSDPETAFHFSQERPETWNVNSTLKYRCFRIVIAVGTQSVP